MEMMEVIYSKWKNVVTSNHPSYAHKSQFNLRN